MQLSREIVEIQRELLGRERLSTGRIRTLFVPWFGEEKTAHESDFLTGPFAPTMALQAASLIGRKGELDVKRGPRGPRPESLDHWLTAEVFSSKLEVEGQLIFNILLENIVRTKTKCSGGTSARRIMELHSRLVYIHKTGTIPLGTKDDVLCRLTKDKRFYFLHQALE